jgi:hypothetical protein
MILWRSDRGVGGQVIMESFIGDYSLRLVNHTEKVDTLAFDQPNNQINTV